MVGTSAPCTSMYAQTALGQLLRSRQSCRVPSCTQASRAPDTSGRTVPPAPSRATTAPTATHAQRRGSGSARLPRRRVLAPGYSAPGSAEDIAHANALLALYRALDRLAAWRVDGDPRTRSALHRAAVLAAKHPDQFAAHTRDGPPRFHGSKESMLQSAGKQAEGGGQPAAEGRDWSRDLSQRMRDFGRHRDNAHSAWQESRAISAST